MSLDVVMLIVALVSLAAGLLLGLLRGSNRSVLRLVLVLLCIVGAFLLRNVVTKAILNIQVSGGEDAAPLSLEQLILQMIMARVPEQYASVGETLLPIIQLLATALVFLALFLVLQLCSWLILFPLGKLIVKKGKKKRALVGGIVGAVQGVAVALVLCVMLNGLFANAAKTIVALESLNDMQNSLSAVVDESSVLFADGNGDSTESVGEPDNGSQTEDGEDVIEKYKTIIVEYNGSKCNIAMSKVGGNAMFDFVANSKTEDGQKLTLNGQIDAISGMVDMAKELTEITKIDLNKGFTTALVDDVVEIFNKLDELNATLSTESKETINTLVRNMAEDLIPAETGISLDAIDFTTINFAKEGEVISELSSYKDKDVASLTQEDATAIVETALKSDIILPLLASQDSFTANLDDKQKEYAEQAITSLTDVDKEKIDMLRNLFGLSAAE